MKSFTFALIVAALGLLCIIHGAGKPKTMTVTLPTGETVKLNEDSTYEYTGAYMDKELERVTFAIQGGKQVLLRENGTWFIGKKLPEEYTPLRLSARSASTSAVASKGSVTQSMKAAKVDAYNKMVSRIRGLIPDKKFTTEMIKKCVGSQVKDNKLNVQTVSGTKVRVGIEFANEEIVRIEQCLESLREQERLRKQKEKLKKEEAKKKAAGK
ncbi:MAG: hypothetical protein GF398_17880 [Chitinivibrionales bacterium]|nr:hypothetical protein [Chitinivibrionales bacterium]